MKTLSKQNIALIVLAVVILGLVGWYLATRPTPVALAPSAATTTPSIATTTSSTSISLANGDNTYRDVQYKVDVTMPSTPSFKGAAGPAAMNSMKMWEQSVLSDFKDSIKNNQQGIDDLHASGNAETPATMSNANIAISYKIYTASKTVSYVYTVASYTGGAHGGEYFKTFTFDKATGGSLELADLFQPNAKYLDAVSKYSRANLPDLIASIEQVQPIQVDTQMIESGVAPTSQNFADWYLDAKGNLDIIFPPYAVGPYVLGAVTLPIPLSSVKSILKPAYQ